MTEIVENLRELCLDVLSEEWVQSVYYSEFLEFEEFPQEYESVLESLEIRSMFRSLMKAIERWLSSEDQEDKSWASLSHQIEHQKLLAVLGYFIDHGTKNVLTKEYRNNALLASRLYFKLMSISGFKAYHIYHSQLFANSLGCLGFPKAMCDRDDNYHNTKELTKEVNSVIKELQPFVKDLRCVMENLQLGPSDMNFEDILSNLVDVTGGAIVNKLNVDKIDLVYITYVIYEIIDILICGDSQSEPNPIVIRLLFKVILPKLLAASVDTRNSNNLVRASYVTYSGLLLSKYGKAALSGYTVLLQHLCYNQDGLERAEVRSARVQLVIGMMSLLPRKSHRTFVQWLIKLSVTGKMAHRHIAMEMLSKLLSNENDPEEPQPEGTAPETTNNETNGEQQENNNEADSQQTTEDESNKESSAVDKNLLIKIKMEPRAKPSTPTVEAEIDLTEEDVADLLLERAHTVPHDKIVRALYEREAEIDLTEEDVADLLLERAHTVPHDKIVRALYEREAEIDLTEEDVADLLLERAHTVPHDEIVRALYERVSDVSSTLRARALAILSDCLIMQEIPLSNAIQELNGTGPVSRLMALAARCVCDERAAVRRAAVALVHRSLARHEATLDRNDLAILVGLCRDASILVRSAAITALGELVSQRPSDAVFDAFLSGPMHQLSDPETRIQEQVMTLVQQILIDRLQKRVEGSAEDTTPWLFLSAVTRHNMRRHLQKACGLLACKTTCISHRLVDTVSTHLCGSDESRDLHVLVLLTSAARHLDCNDMSFLLHYYYALDDKPPQDGRLLPLTLELLTLWSRWTRPDDRTALRDHLVQRLAGPYDNGCRLAAASLAANLDPTNLTWATELMQLSERSALNSTEVEEWIRAADLSLVAPAPPSPALLRLFVESLADPPAEWSDIDRGASVAGCGRLCVRSRDAAALAAPAMAQLLQDEAAPLCARVNALLALTDICTRYTCIVEPLLGCVCNCLSGSTSAPLRRAAARSLTRLLLAGYLRLRTPLYYRYCALLADEDHDVREPAEYYVTCCLTTDAIYHHFVDCIMHYNQDQDEGNLSFDARQLIYDVMLQRLSIVQKLNLQCRLAREILEHTADVTDEGDGELPASLNAALLDTITLLCGPRMKLPRRPQRDGDANDIDDLQERVTTNIVSHKMKKTVAEVVVPAVLRLYSRLAPRGGQVAAYLVRIANDLLNDYRQEIEELIENDEELVERVRQFQENIGIEPSFGNSRNLVTTSTTHEPETPKTYKRRAPRNNRSPTRKRALRI